MWIEYTRQSNTLMENNIFITKRKVFTIASFRNVYKNLHTRIVNKNFKLVHSQ